MEIFLFFYFMDYMICIFLICIYLYKIFLKKSLFNIKYYMNVKLQKHDISFKFIFIFIIPVK